MPIHDFNGTTAYQIGKVHDFDGTTAHQIGKVCDHDGTASHLIYTAETQVYPGTAVQNLAVMGGTYGAFYTHLEGDYRNNLNSTVVYIPVDLTEFKTMTIGCNCYTQQNLAACSGIWLSSPGQWQTGTVCYPYYTISLSNEASNMQYATRMWRVNNGDWFPSVTWDVSGLSGVYYLAAGCYVNNGAHLAHAEINTVTLV